MSEEASSPRLSELVEAPAQGRRFERELLPGLADVTPGGRARLDAIARWLQDIAYADVLDAGLAGRGAWVVRRLRMRVERFPAFSERLRVRTFCSGVGPLVAERRTTVRGAAAAVEAVALWVHLDPDTLRPARLGEEFDAIYGASASGRRVRSRLRHPPAPAEASRTPWRFRASDLDVAGHVNNAAYWEPVEERLAAGAAPATADVEIEFREPAAAGPVVVRRSGRGLWVEGEDGTAHASILGVPSA